MKVEIPFADYFGEKVSRGEKTVTSRTKRYGKAGDTFNAFGTTFRLIDVSRQTLTFVSVYFYDVEGFLSPEHFRRFWEGLHPRRGYIGSDLVWVHRFERLDSENNTAGDAP